MTLTRSARYVSMIQNYNRNPLTITAAIVGSATVGSDGDQQKENAIRELARRYRVFSPSIPIHRMIILNYS
jgi:hypothetical protein